MTISSDVNSPTANSIESRALVKLALPIIMTGLAEMAINATDVVMMGWLGADAIASGILGGHLYSITHFFGLGILAAVAPMIAQALGARRYRIVRRSVRQGLWMGLTVALPATVLLWYAQPVLLALGQSPQLTPGAESYLQTRMWGFLPAMWFLVLSHFLSAHSRPRAIMVVTIIAIVINAIGNYGLMFGNFGLPRLELAGAGISSSVVDVFLAAGLLFYVLRDRRFKRYHILARIWHPDWSRYFEILRLGLPIAGTILSEAGLFFAASLLIGRLGAAQLAGHAVAVQCAAIAYMIPYGIGQAATVRVGLAAGASDLAGVSRAAWTAMLLGCGFMLLPAAAFWIWGLALAGLFLDLNDPVNLSAARFAASFLAVAAFFQLVDGAQSIAAGSLRGIKDTRVPMMLALGSYWGVGFGMAVLFGFVLGYEGIGVWVGLAFGLAAAALALTWRFKLMSRRSLTA